MLCGPAVRRCWKHSRQYTGRPCVGLNGTVVSLPHCEQTVLVSTRCTLPEPAPLLPCARLALHALHRLGSFLKPLSEKNICSPAVNTNSAPHSEHFRTLSWYSMSRSPPDPCETEGWAHLAPWAYRDEDTVIRGNRARIPWACGHEAATETQRLCLTGPESRKCGAE